MSIPFVKPPLDFDKQYRKLRQHVSDTDYTLGDLLLHSSFYRIKSYLAPLQSKYPHALIPAHEVKELMAFDSELRMLIFRCIEPIEVYFRATISEYMLSASGGDSFWYLDERHFEHKAKHIETLKTIKDEFSRSRETFITDYKKSYILPSLSQYHKATDNMPPTWMVNEICSFGLFSKMFQNLQLQHRKNIAKAFLVDEQVLKSWILSLSFVRNVCAHHARLWNKVAGVSPKVPKQNPFPIPCNPKRVSIILQILIRLLTVIEGEHSAHIVQIQQAIVTAPPFIQRGMGFYALVGMEDF